MFVYFSNTTIKRTIYTQKKDRISGKIIFGFFFLAGVGLFAAMCIQIDEYSRSHKGCSCRMNVAPANTHHIYNTLRANVRDILYIYILSKRVCCVNSRTDWILLGPNMKEKETNLRVNRIFLSKWKFVRAWYNHEFEFDLFKSLQTLNFEFVVGSMPRQLANKNEP